MISRTRTLVLPSLRDLFLVQLAYPGLTSRAKICPPLRGCSLAILNCPKPTTKGCVDFLFLLLEEVSLLEFAESLLQLLLCVHHDRTIPCDRLF